jgi:two-component system KDP operon response regulator KdpE
MSMILSRTRRAASVYRMEGICIDMAAHAAPCDGAAVHVTRTEWTLLETFVAASGRLLTPPSCSSVFGASGTADDVEVLRVFVIQLRRKIEPDPRRPRAIATEPEVGYRWTLRPDSDG